MRQPSKPQAAWASSWVRQRYIVEGDLIQPLRASGTPPLEWYDPFAEEDGVHTALASLNSEAPEEVERFVSRWGLLGTFLHNLRRQQYAPDERGWITTREMDRHTLRVEEGPHWRQAHYEDPRRGKTGAALLEAETRVTVLLSTGLGRIEEGEFRWNEPGEPIPGNELRRVFTDGLRRELSQPVVEAASLRGMGTYTQPLLPYYKRYFPSCATGDDPRFPRLGSPEMWNALCEPLPEFRQACSDFQEASHLGTRLLSRGILPPEERSRLEALFQVGLRDVVPYPRTEARRPARTRGPLAPVLMGFRCPSLLAVAYQRLLQSLAGGTMQHSCANVSCGRHFSTTRSNKVYCSETCQNTQKARNYRMAKRGEK